MAKRLFDGYDADKSGTMDLDEFILLVQKYDSDVDPASVERSFQATPSSRLSRTASLSLRDDRKQGRTVRVVV